MGLLALCSAPTAALADCTKIGGSTVCDGDVSHTQVGREVIFPHGPPGEKTGEFVTRPQGTLPQVLPKGPDQPPPGPRPLNRADRLTDPRHGEDFGAFEYPTGPSPLGQSPAR